MADAVAGDVGFAKLGNAGTQGIVAVARATGPFRFAEHAGFGIGNFFDVGGGVKMVFSANFLHFFEYGRHVKLLGWVC